MIQLLNRIAWLACLSIWILFAILVWGNPESWLAGIVFWMILKWIFLSRQYIESRVEHFSKVALKISKCDSTVNGNSTESPASPKEEINKQSDNFSKKTLYEDTWYNDEHLAWVEWVNKNTEQWTDEIKIHSTNDISYATKKSEKSEDTWREIEWFEKTWDVFHRFFSENILAKIWWILVFLWVLFLLSLVWSAIPWILKLFIGFIIGMICYFSWIRLDKKWLPNEGRILMWIAILINYAVILSGRYIIWETSIDTTPLFSGWISFIFLILNTIFAVVTSLYYKSNTLLIFAFLFAYANPFLVWLQETTPYLQVWYAMIVSLWALFLAWRRSNIFVLLIAFFCWNLLLYIAPNTLPEWEVGYMTKYLSIIFLSLLSLLSVLKMSIQEKWLVEVLFSASFFAVWLFWLIWWANELHLTNYVLSIAAAFLFMIFSYFHMQKWPYLYSIWSIAWAIILASHTSWSNLEFLSLNLFTVLLYLIINIFAGLLLKIDDEPKLKNLVLWSLSWILFVGFSIYWYSLVQDKSIEFTGIVYLFLSFIYFVISYIFILKTWLENIKEDSLKQNTVYNFLAIWISLLSIAIALIFSNYHFIVALFWLLESAILFFFYHKVKDLKIVIAGLILMWLWIVEWFSELKNIDWIGTYIWPWTLMLCILWFNAIKTKIIQIKNMEGVHDALHIFWIIGAIAWISLSLKGNAESVFIFSIAIFLIWLSYFYKLHWSDMLKKWFVGLFIFVMCSHLTTYVNDIYKWDLSIMNTFFQYIISMIFMIAALIQILPRDDQSSTRQVITVFLLLYLFIVTTFYVYHIFPNTFAVTLYWGILAFLLISRGISKDIIALRTIGLYLVSLVCFKILFVDITTWISDNIIKVFAFIAVWVMFIIIWTMYSRKYGNKLKWEFDLSNITWGSFVEETSIKNNNQWKNDEKIILDEAINKVDISGISSITFKPNWGKPFSTKSKNLMRIVKLVMGNVEQAHYSPGELQDDYDYIVNNHTFSLTKTERERVQNAIKDFVERWGKVIVK